MTRITWWTAAIATGALPVLVGLRVHTQPRDASKEIEQVYNSQAFAARSTMPRFGREGILTEAQIAHLVTLQLEPVSPVNQ
jgi:hypothetical protein